jgi:hypothetical protein
MGESELSEVIDAVDAANLQMLEGNWAGWQELLSHSDEVTLLGAQGGVVHGWTEVVHGWTEVAARFERTGEDLACLVDLERHEGRWEGQAQPVTFLYRTTHVLRRENGAWKVVLRHADRLAEFRGPQFAHAAATVSEPPSEEVAR